MLAVVSLLLGTITTNPRNVVYTARYFSQGISPSYEQVYLIRHDGTRRQQVTYGNANHPTAFWLDSRYVIYVEMANGRRIVNPLGEYSLYDARIYRLDTVTSKSKRIGTVPKVKGVSGQEGDAISFFAHGLSVSVRVRHNSIQPWPTYLPAVSNVMHFTDQSLGDGKISRTMKFKTTWGEAEANWIASESVSNPSSETLPFTISVGSSIQQFELKGSIIYGLEQGEDGAIYIRTGLPKKQMSDHHFVYRMATPTSEFRTIVSEVGHLEFDPANRFWFAGKPEIQEGAQVTMPNGRIVNTKALYCGEWSTRKRWTLASGLVAVTSHDMRPQK